MWNNAFIIQLKGLLSDASFRRFVFALGLSLLLHFFLIGRFYFNLPTLAEKPLVIVATLLVPQPPPQLALETPQPPPAPSIDKQKKAIEPKPKPVDAKPDVNSAVEAPSMEIEPATDLGATEVLSPELVAPEASAQIAQPEQIETANDAQTEENPIEINLNAYQKVDAEFDVYTAGEASPSNSPAGSAHMAFERMPDDNTYQIKSLIKARGLAALVIPDLLQTSAGDIGQAGLKPRHYLYQFGNKQNKTFSADFDWEAHQLNLHSVNGSQAKVLADGTQDLLSFMFQFMYVPPLQNMQLNITNGKKVGVYDYSFEGEEVISTKMGELNTVHLLRSSAEKEKTTELWLALDYQYVPVKIRETEKDGKVYVLLVKALKTE